VARAGRAVDRVLGAAVDAHPRGLHLLRRAELCEWVRSVAAPRRAPTWALPHAHIQISLAPARAESTPRGREAGAPRVLICTAALWVNPLVALRSFFVCARKLAQKYTSLPAAGAPRRRTAPACSLEQRAHQRFAFSPGMPKRKLHRVGPNRGPTLGL
jgi:hypothetical protein